MNISLAKKWLGVVAVSGAVFASSLYNTVPAPTYAVSADFNFESGSPFRLIESPGLERIAIKVAAGDEGFSVREDSFREEIMLEKRAQQLLNKEQSQLAAKKPQEPVESKSTEVKTQNIEKEVTTPPAAAKSKPAPANTESAPARDPKQTTQKSAASTVSRGAGEIEQLLDMANGLLGVPYLWGGTTPKGFDCSGFVGYVFKASGISLPRTSFEMYKVGTPVKRDELRSGDLVFFSTYTDGASDVRIYIGGNRTIGASGTGVDIRSLSESFWDEHYYGARRVL